MVTSTKNDDEDKGDFTEHYYDNHDVYDRDNKDEISYFVSSIWMFMMTAKTTTIHKGTICMKMMTTIAMVTKMIKITNECVLSVHFALTARWQVLKSTFRNTRIHTA